MKQALVSLWFIVGLATVSLASASSDSTAKELFPKLTEQIGLKSPNLKADEHEIRIWNRKALRYGDAQTVYILRKTEKRFTILKYIINSNKQGFQFAKHLKPTVTITLALWNRLLRRNILTLPDQSIVFERLYPKPKPTKDTIQTKMEADGNFTIKASKTTKRRTIVGDGEGFSFELFSTDGYRVYNYSNPDVYMRDEPQCEELQNIVGILNDLSLVFSSDKSGRDQARAINDN